jgi:hypothetical protein
MEILSEGRIDNPMDGPGNGCTISVNIASGLIKKIDQYTNGPGRIYFTADELISSAVRDKLEKLADQDGRISGTEPAAERAPDVVAGPEQIEEVLANSIESYISSLAPVLARLMVYDIAGALAWTDAPATTAHVVFKDIPCANEQVRDMDARGNIIQEFSDRIQSFSQGDGLRIFLKDFVEGTGGKRNT